MMILALIAGVASVAAVDQSASLEPAGTAPIPPPGSSLLQVGMNLSRSHRSRSRNAHDEAMPYLMEDSPTDESSLMPADALFEESESFHSAPRFRSSSVTPISPALKVDYGSVPSAGGAGGNNSRLEKFQKTKSWEEEMMDRIQKYRGSLQSMKDNIVTSVNQIRNEKKWVHDVNKIMRTYVDKVSRVTNNIKKLQDQTQRELKLKKMTEKNILQTTLAIKLKEAQWDYYALEKALKSTNKQRFRFQRSQVDVKKDIDRIRQSLGSLESGQEDSAIASTHAMTGGGSLTQGEQMGEPDLETMESVDSLISTPLNGSPGANAGMNSPAALGGL